MKFDDAAVQAILLKGGYIGEEDFSKAQTYATAHGTSVSDYLLAEGLLNKDVLGQAIAESVHVPYADLNSNQPDKEQILKLPENIARQYRAILFKDAEEATIATDEPTREGLAAALAEALKKKVTIAFSLKEDVDSILMQYVKPLDTRFSKIIAESEHVAPEILDEIFADALTLNASDIHFEPRSKFTEVRFRIDGVLHEAGRIPKENYENILNRLKVLGHERIDEHHSAQDGSLRFEKDGKVVDMRSSIIPTVDGEKVVLRLLMSYVQGLALGDIGFSAEHQRLIEEASEKPFGMILVTGPTGSGKTTTLYALIRKLNQPDVNITTIEDPVEYKVEGINQIQVNPQTNLTFAQGLRSIVRQDPDVILVGEIRDDETAEIAVNAALTGHLLLSTFHANDAATVIPRLLDMKIEPFLLASTLVVVIGQRLARKLCEQCRHSTDVERAELAKKYPGIASYFKDAHITLYEGTGCSACNQTGFRGRTGLFEFIRITPELQDLMLKRPSTQEVWKLAHAQGSRSLFEDGIAKVMSGTTTLEELLRVAEVPAEILKK